MEDNGEARGHLQCLINESRLKHMWNHLLVVLVGMVTARYLLINYIWKSENLRLATSLSNSYDYIVIGAGSAGSVIASRLSEDKASSVLILEAGGWDLGNHLLDIPGYTDKIVLTHMDWQYFTVPQKYSAFAMEDNRAFWPRGKTIGGTSSINSMVYMRGSRHDYDEWERRGATGWGYDDVLPYFLRSEQMLSSTLAKSKAHDDSGPIPIQETAVTPLADIFLQGGEQIGYKSHDCNGDDGDIVGFCRLQSYCGYGLRSSTGRYFLLPVMDRPNLDIAVKAHVTKILFRGKQAVGLELIHDGTKKTVMVKHEIILSAGAVGSPQILMLSGIGPKQHLVSHGIDVVADLPVGENLQDHMMFPVALSINQSLTVGPQELFGFWSQLKYSLYKGGHLSRNAMREATAFVRTNPDDPDLAPDVQYLLHSTPSQYHEKFTFTKFFKKEVMQHFKEMERSQSKVVSRLTIGMMAPLHPKSTGNIRLKSKDPFDHPLIDPQALREKEDVKTIIRGLRLMKKLISTEAFQRVGATWPQEHFAACKKHKFDSDDYLECTIRYMALTNYHPTSTCTMGRATDKNAVVDPELRVIGVKGLRVADASIMPFVTASNTNAPAIMIGEKAVDLIKGNK